MNLAIKRIQSLANTMYWEFKNWLLKSVDIIKDTQKEEKMYWQDNNVVLYWVLINTNWAFIKVFDTLDEARKETINNPYATKTIIQCCDIYDRCNYCNTILYDDGKFILNEHNYCNKCYIFINTQWSDWIIQ